jgi:hypothetical protein
MNWRHTGALLYPYRHLVYYFTSSFLKSINLYRALGSSMEYVKKLTGVS